MTKHEESQFGFAKRKRIFDNYIGEWAVIRVPGIPASYAGQIKDIIDEYAILSPFQYIEHGNDGTTFFYKINEGPISSLVPLGGSIEPTTRENIENYMKYHNNEIQNDLMRSNKKSAGLLRKLVNSLRNKVI